MAVYTFSEARQNFASLLEKAEKEGKVLIKRKDGSIFEVLPITPKGSPLDGKGMGAGVAAPLRRRGETLRPPRLQHGPLGWISGLKA